MSKSFQQIRCPEPAEGRAAGPVRKHTRRARDARADLSLCATTEPVDASMLGAFTPSYADRCPLRGPPRP